MYSSSDTGRSQTTGALVAFDPIARCTISPQTEGLPSVASCAAALHLSPGYFGDLIKKETGRTAQDYIHTKLIYVTIERIIDQDKSVSEIAYELGFTYPQHFTRLFKQRVGQSPNEYRLQQ